LFLIYTFITIQSKNFSSFFDAIGSFFGEQDIILDCGKA